MPYPYASAEPRTSVVFNENEVLRAIAPTTAGPGDTIKLWYNDEHALTLGIRQVVVKTGSGTTTTNYPVTPMVTNPDGAVDPAVGTTAQDGDQAGTDTSSCAGFPDHCDRPIFPSIFVTDITADPTSMAGDWQLGGTAVSPDAVFGTWKAAVRTVDQTKSPTLVTVTPDADPAKNNWDLDGGDAAPVGAVNQGYGAEARWNVNDLGLIAGHSYRIQFMVHDGDQNKTGGDVGEACANVVMTTGSTTTTTTPGGSTTTTTLPATCQGTTTIASNFNNTPIDQDDFIWFNSVVKIGNVPSNTTVTVRFEQGLITFDAPGGPYSISLPNAQVTIDPAATAATTTYDAVTNTWFTVSPKADKNLFLTGIPFQVPVPFPGGIDPVTWSGQFTADTPDVKPQWKWAAAVYPVFSTDHNLLGVKPTDDGTLSAYKNGDHAGTPENFKNNVIGGARGGGNSNYTGSYTNSNTVTCALPTRTVGFFRARPDTVDQIAVSPITVCGHTLDNTTVGSASSFLEAMCVETSGDERRQLFRQLVAAALNMASGTGATFPQYDICDAVCRNYSTATPAALSDCITLTEAFNLSGDGMTLTYPTSLVDDNSCEQATASLCDVLNPGTCPLP